jgi:hypothetical protein
MSHETPQNPVLAQVVSIIKDGIVEYVTQKQVDESHQPTIPLSEANYDTLAHAITVPVEYSDILVDTDTLCAAVKRHLTIAGYANISISLDRTNEARLVVYLTVPTTSSYGHTNKSGPSFVKLRNIPPPPIHSNTSRCCGCMKCLCWTLVPLVIVTVAIATVGMIF